MKCGDAHLSLLTTVEQMGEGGISVVFVGFFAGEKEVLEAANDHPGFYRL